MAKRLINVFILEYDTHCQYAIGDFLEWKNLFNPFNSLKVLCWRDRFEEILEGGIPAPVSVTVDAANACDLKCEWCHYSDFRKNKEIVSKEDLLWLADALPKLGVVSNCLAGGGEFLVNPVAGEYMRRVKDNGIDVGLITNGTHIDTFMDDILYSCRWVGVSVDAASASLYEQLKGKAFYHVIENIKNLARKRPDRSSPSIGFKFLIHPSNYHELMDAVRLAQSLGVDQFHARPGYGPGIMWDKHTVRRALELVKNAQCMLETENFHVFGVTHKFDEEFQKIVVDKCEVTPIGGLTFAADGFCYICCDLRGEAMGRLCKWREILDVWGSEKHRKLLENLDPKKCPRRCTFNAYQEVLERVFRGDEMTYKFP